MKLNKKKELAAKTLEVGKGRIVFNIHRLNDIKDAITKQDIRGLYNDGAILIREIHGSKTKVKRKTRRRAGSIRKIPGNKKRKYIILTRKLRAYLFELRKAEKITEEQYQKLRKEIRASAFRSKAHMKERLQ